MTVFNSSSRNKVVKVALGQGGSQIVGKHTLAIYGFRQYRVGYTKWMLKGSSMAPISVNPPKVGYNPEKIDVHISRFKGGIIIMAKTSKYLKKNAAVKDLKRGFVASKDDLDCAILTGGFVAGILKDGQTREHALLAFTIGVRKMICCCNKRSLDMIKGMTPEEIRKTFNIKNDFTPEEEEEVRRENKTFNIKNDFTPEEEEEVRRENQWAFE